MMNACDGLEARSISESFCFGAEGSGRVVYAKPGYRMRKSSYPLKGRLAESQSQSGCTG